MRQAFAKIIKKNKKKIKNPSKIKMLRIGVALIVLGGGTHSLNFISPMHFFILATKMTLKTYRKIKNKEFFNPKTPKSFYKGGFASVMTRREAQLILNVREGAQIEKIRDNHRKLMLLNHPDNGSYLF